MSILIKGLDMPKSCWDCELLSSCKAMPKNPTAEEIGIYTVTRLKDCPLVEIPTPHGRLIAEDSIFEAFSELEPYRELIRNYIITIIEAEE